MQDWVFSRQAWIKSQPSLCITSLVIPLVNPRYKVNWQVDLCTNKGSVKRVCLLLLLIISGDIQSHPGPNTPMCSICDHEIKLNHTSLRCVVTECDRWSHVNCQNTNEQLSNLDREDGFTGNAELLSTEFM